MKSLLLEMSDIVGDTKLFSPQSAFLPGLFSQDIWIVFHSWFTALIRETKYLWIMQNKVDLKGGIKETQTPKNWPYRKIAGGMENLWLEKVYF